MHVVEIDAASHTGIDDVREVIIASAAFSPPPGQFRIFIIDEVHQLSNHAFNGLLKTIEEPPPRVIFIMATTEIQKVPDTILSRCQVFEFRTIQLNKIVAELSRIVTELGIQITESALSTIARAGEGSMRDAESALDQVISFAGGGDSAGITDEDVSAALGLVSYETLNRTLAAIASQDSSELLAIVEEITSRGLDLRNFCRDLMGHIRSLLVIKAVGIDAELNQMPRTEAESLTEFAAEFSEQDLVRFFSLLSKTEQDIRLSSQQRFQLEIGLVKMAQAGKLHSIEEAMSRLTALEAQMSGSAPAPGQIAAAAGRPDPPIAERRNPYTPRAVVERTAAVPQRQPERDKDRGERVSASSPSRASGRSDPATLPRAGAGSGPPPEPPPLMDEPPDQEWNTRTTGTDGAQRGTAEGIPEPIKQAFEARQKHSILAMLELADSVQVDGDYLSVAYSRPNAVFKGKVESRDIRSIIEDVYEEVYKGKRLSLTVAIAGSQAGSPKSPVSKTNSPIVGAKRASEMTSADRASAPTAEGPATAEKADVQILRQQGRLHRLQEREAASALCQRTGKDYSQEDNWHMFPASATACRCH